MAVGKLIVSAVPILVHLDQRGKGDVRVVGRLGHVDVVVRVDGLLGSHLSAHHLDSSITNDLVDIHIRLRSGSSLEHDEGEFVHAEFTGNDLVGCFSDMIGDILVEAVGLVDCCSCFFEDTESFD